MPKDRRSFFERLTGSVPAEEYYEEEAEEPTPPARAHLAAGQTKTRGRPLHAKKEEEWLGGAEEEGQLTVDVFQTDNEILLQAMVAGVRPDDLDVQITRDMITIRGRREQSREIEKDDFFYQELYWGAFSRSVLLPQEVDVDGSEATLKQGLLIIRLPKLDKNRTERLRVKTNDH